METQKTIIEYDLELFNIFQTSFSLKYPELFENKKLFNSRGRKCNFILKSLKNIILKKENNIEVKKAINTLLELLSEKEQNAGLCYLSSFDYELYTNYKDEILEFRNEITECIFDYIINQEKNTKCSFTEKIHAAFTIIFEDYKFLKSLFDIIEYSLDKNIDIYNEFLNLLNNKDIFQKIIENKNCILNTHQKEFIISNKIILDESASLLKELKAKTITNDELLKELDDISSNKNSKKKGKKSSKKNKKVNIIASNNDEPKAFSNNTINNASNKNAGNTININNSNIDDKAIKDDDKECLNKSLTERINSLEKINVHLLKEIEVLKKTTDDLRNRIDICETKINMICYRDLIKDIINYSFKYFNVEKIFR